jgi:tRNA(fMet)-specific endonuclease VapC
LNEFLIPFSVLDFDYLASVEYGIIRSELEKKGTLIGSLDMLIAAQAKSQGLTLITNNQREFSRIEALK